MKNYLIISALVFSVSNVISQESLDRHCSAEELSSEERVAFYDTMQKIKKYKRKKNASYIIPVIFHIFSDNSGSISKENMKCRIDDALEVLNGDFNGTSSGFENVDPRFDSIKDKMNIEFIAAVYDPFGGELEYPGMDWQISANVSYGKETKLLNYLWWGDIGKYYLDIAIVNAMNNASDTNGSGYGIFPTSNKTPYIALNHKTLRGACSSGTWGPGWEKIIVHELGHYLGLEHTFLGGCAELNDGVDDTPPTSGNEGCTRNVLNSCGVYPNLENHMDYNHDDCQGGMFTKGQVSVMEYWLDSSTSAPYKRSLLWGQANLESTLGSELLSTEEFTDSEAVLVYPNPSRDVFTVDLSKLKGQSITLSLYDVQGKLLFEENYEKSPNEVSVGDRLANAGSYFVRIETAAKNKVLHLVKI